LGLLVASHIKPWRLCDSAFERLDGANGLLLAPHVDLLFDRGFVSFTNDGGVLVSSKVAALDLERLGLFQACAKKTGEFAQRQKVYLEYHRANVFIP
jgi:predicted restriction endonuclease